MKRRVVNALAKHVVNPVMRRVAGRVPGWALLETTGRRSGRPHRVPVGDGLRDATFWIVATNASVEGEATSVFLEREIRPLGPRVTRLARGIPVGSDLEYVDGTTIAQALAGRREM